jgi:protein-L-isoaspartate O-methyltransferase
MSLGRDYFDRLYDAEPDPWGFSTRWYERRKREVLLASLPRERFSAAFEPGCSTGELTAALALRCDALLAADVAAGALDTARQRTAGLGNVTLERRALPDNWPVDREFDLVVLSEIGYYLDRAALSRTLDLAVGALGPGGVLVTCHWQHPALEYPLTGAEVVAGVDAAADRFSLVRLVEHIEEDFRLAVHGLPGAASVARADGVV